MSRAVPSLAQWRARHILYKQGAIGVVLALLLFLLGFSLPAWAHRAGLWISCSSGDCASNLHTQTDGWMTATRVVESLALVALVLCVVLSVLQDCCHLSGPVLCHRAVECLACVAGILGVTGAAVFGSQTMSDASSLQSSPPQTDIHHHEDHQSTLQWGFALTVTASIIAVLSSVAIGYSRCYHGQSGAYNVKMSAEEQENTPTEAETDSSAMMLVPAGHFDNASPPTKWERDPPQYALPPPYPYPSNCSFILPIANSSVVPQITDISSSSKSGDVTVSADQSQSFSNMDGVFASSSFMTPVSAYQVPSKRLAIRPLFVKTDGGSEIEITPSANNSSGLPSPYNHF